MSEHRPFDSTEDPVQDWAGPDDELSILSPDDHPLDRDGGSDPEGGTRLVEHDATGLDLARTVARSVGAQARRRRAARPQRSTAPKLPSSGAQDRDPTLLGAAVDRLMDAKGWTTEINVHTLLARWASLVGAVNAEHSRPESYADGVLTVRTESTVWATSLRTMAPQLLARLNEQLGDGTVGRIKVLGPAAPSWKKGPRSVRDGRGPRDTYG
jgi:predicted nucleic acid-binding Zn ribbon protein